MTECEIRSGSSKKKKIRTGRRHERKYHQSPSSLVYYLHKLTWGSCLLTWWRAHGGLLQVCEQQQQQYPKPARWAKMSIQVISVSYFKQEPTESYYFYIMQQYVMYIMLYGCISLSEVCQSDLLCWYIRYFLFFFFFFLWHTVWSVFLLLLFLLLIYYSLFFLLMFFFPIFALHSLLL